MPVLSESKILLQYIGEERVFWKEPEDIPKK